MRACLPRHGLGLLIGLLLLPAVASEPVLPSQAQALVPPSRAQAQCAVRAWEGYRALREQHALSVEQALLRQDPGLTGIAAAERQAARLELEREQQRLRHLAQNQPARLRLDLGLAGLWDGQWSAADEQALRVAEPDYPDLARRADQARAATQDPGRQRRLAEAAERLGPALTGLAASSALQQALARAEAALTACR